MALPAIDGVPNKDVLCHILIMFALKMEFLNGHSAGQVHFKDCFRIYTVLTVA